ncbi:MAG: hypothetical protein QXJ06_02075 [Candidatus Aenigmatarchaeota archaeon]
MNKDLLKKSWFLALLLIFLSFILALGSYFLNSIRGDNTSIEGIFSTGITAAVIVGFIYASNFKDVVPMKLRIETSIIVLIFQIIINAIYGILFSETITFFFVFFVISIFYSLVIYFLLYLSGKIYLKFSRKSKEI